MPQNAQFQKLQKNLIRRAVKIEDSPFGILKIPFLGANPWLLRTQSPHADPPETPLLALFRRLKDFEDLYQQQGCLWQMARPKTLEPTEWIWHTNSKYGPQFAASALEILHHSPYKGEYGKRFWHPSDETGIQGTPTNLTPPLAGKYKALQLINAQVNNTDQNKNPYSSVWMEV